MLEKSDIEILDENRKLRDFVSKDKVYETEYTIDSPDVVEWTHFFKDRADIDEMFSCIRGCAKNSLNSRLVSTVWHHFTSAVPKILLSIANSVDDNLALHYIVQVIFEELGGRNSKMLHADLFLETISTVNISAKKLSISNSQIYEELPIKRLLKNIAMIKNQHEALGLILGLEINANENIETLVSHISYDQKAKDIVEKSKFFVIHREVESEHIRLNVSNFLRFCPSRDDKSDFISGFDSSIKFWKEFWLYTSNLSKKEECRDV